MPDIYRRLGVRPIINARGTHTRLGGTLIRPAHELVVALEEHDPRVFLFEPTGPTARPNSILINTQTMQPGEERIVVEALREAIGMRLPRKAAVAV